MTAPAAPRVLLLRGARDHSQQLARGHRAMIAPVGRECNRRPPVTEAGIRIREALAALGRDK